MVLENMKKVILCKVMDNHDWSRMELGDTVQYRCLRCGLYVNPETTEQCPCDVQDDDGFFDGTVVGGVSTGTDIDTSANTVTINGSVYGDTSDQTGSGIVEVLNTTDSNVDNDSQDYSDPCVVLDEIEQGNISTRLYELTNTQLTTLMSILSVECEAVQNDVSEQQIHRPTDYHSRYDTFNVLVKHGFLCKLDDTHDSTARYVVALPDE